MKFIKCVTVIFTILAAIPVNCFSYLGNFSPIQACSFLSNLGLGTRGWKVQYDDVHGCSSPYKEIGSGNPITNNLAYYVDGTSNNVDKLKIVLNINNKAEATQAKAELLKASKSLCLKVTGKELPQSIVQAIKIGKNSATKIEKTSIEVVSIDWPTGKGYEIKLIME